MEVEEGDWVLPPAGDFDGEEIVLSDKVLVLRFEGPFEQMVQGLVKARALEKQAARLRFPVLPQWMFTSDGLLMALVPEWNHMGCVCVCGLSVWAPAC